MTRDIVITVASFLFALVALGVLGVPLPGQLAVLVALGVATWRLRVARQGWRDVGVRRGTTVFRVLGWAIAAYVATILANVAIVLPLAHLRGWPPLGIEALGNLAGNTSRLVAMLLVSWTTAAFGEELLFRGFLMTRLEGVFGARRIAIAGAVVLQAMAFAAGHIYLGVRGAATACVVGLIYGIVYYRCGRNLWPLIVAHGLTDTISMVVLYHGYHGIVAN